MAKDITSKAEFDSLIQQDQFTLIDFWAPWCGPCKAIAPTVDELAHTLDGRVQVCKVDVDQLPELSEAHGVMAIPTFMMFRSGQVVDRLVGGGNPAQLRLFVAKTQTP